MLNNDDRYKFLDWLNKKEKELIDLKDMCYPPQLEFIQALKLDLILEIRISSNKEILASK